MELLRGAAGALRFPDHDGDPAAFDETPMVTVVRHSNGTPVATGPVTKEGAGDDVFYTAVVDSTATAEVDLLVATWEGEVDGASSAYSTYAEVVGGFVTSLRAIERKYDEAGRSADDYAAAREAATTQVEGACGVAFRPRYAKEVLDGRGTDTLTLLPQLLRVLSVSIAGEALATADLEGLAVDRDGFLISPTRWPEGRANIEIAYVHGYERFPAADLPVRDYAAYLLTESPTDFNQRATSYSTGEITYSLVTPGMRGASFPLPSVNAFVEAHQFVSVG
jgi:hypothetical protein